MKRLLLFASGVALYFTAGAQVQRMVMAEAFSNASCGPCAQQNPGYSALLASNTSKVVAIKYQTNWPGVDPMNAQTQSEVDPRVSFYGVNGVPWGVIDGTPFAGSSYSGAVANLDQAEINARYAVGSPFSLSISHSFSSDMDSIFIQVIIGCPAGHTGNTLKLQVAMIEKTITFSSPPGSNGEKVFHNVMRKMYPNPNGTSLATTWIAGDSQTLNFAGPIPSYIYDYTQIGVIAFIQENTTKEVHQAGISNPIPLVDFVKNVSVSNINTVGCNTNLTGVKFSITNQGTSTVTSLTINQQLDNGSITQTPWSGSILSGANKDFTLADENGITAGSHTMKAWVTDVNNSGINSPIGSIAQYVFNIFDNPATAPIFNDFSSVTFPPTGWILDNYGESLGWSRHTASAGGGQGSARMYNYLIPSGGIRDFYLPRTDISGVTNPILSFDVAYAQYSSENDRLTVSISTNCGTSWTQLYNKAGSSLKTAPATNSSFTPSSSQWRSEYIDLSAYASETDLIIRFRGTSNYGNNLFVDNINIDQSSASVSELESGAEINVYPNPATDKAWVGLTLNDNQTVTVSLVNQLGATIQFTNYETLHAGNHSLPIQTESLASGLYHVVITIGNTSSVVKMAVTH